eukprot:TRINITY_DN44692_c0_g1_i1.p1 TRINITY_DN44692_c0_g1~~TRINITY_DN44692_c0_g1_i1.p1  ORF type:complete len:775 (-),score=151.60 TRINITY_DN44692_c0_g1_i1:65-2251(-)
MADAADVLSLALHDVPDGDDGGGGGGCDNGRSVDGGDHGCRNGHAVGAQHRVRYAALVPNVRGVEAAAAAGAHEATILTAATETMCHRNTNCSLEEALTRASVSIQAAKARGLRTRVAITVAMVCPYEGDVPEERVAYISERMLTEGANEVVLCDTIGQATPRKTQRVLKAVQVVGVPSCALGLHVHDTFGLGMANVLAGLQEGVAVIDTSVGGLGGCPFVGPGASGNLATEDLVYMLDGMGIETGINIEALSETGQWICDKLKRANGSRAGSALVAAESRRRQRKEDGNHGVMQGPAAVQKSRMSTMASSVADNGNGRSGPLTGYRVVELGNFIAGPYCASILSYFGADVIKVETPGRGDPVRYLRSLAKDGQSPWSRSLLRNRRSITVNLKHPDGVAVVRQLIESADAVVENFRPGVLEKFNLGPNDFANSNPGLVFARISGYGQTGPNKMRAGFASAAEGEGGFRFVNGVPGQTSVRPNLSLGDSLAGLHAALGVVMALLHRTKSGKGQVVDTALYEAVYSMTEGMIADYTCLGEVRQPSGATISGVVPTNTHRCADGKYVIIGANADAIFARLMIMIGREDMAKDPRYADNNGRVVHQDDIYKVLDEWCATLPLADALEKLAEARCPAGPIYDAADMMSDPHFQARDLFEDVETTTGLRFQIPAMVPKLSETPGRTAWCGPEVGAHNKEVLMDVLGYSSDEVDRLQANGAVGSERDGAEQRFPE